ncbi:flagellin [Paenibacillus sp. FSL R7-0302]|uniref:flagellin N-terminal helical domain-containing protein n=1 Tax=Paenibacillus sp. FSL R7-0302 TaxID=2921681 RepID=UPI0030F9A27C
MIINHNIAALNTHRQLASNTANTNKNIEKLSSGLRINRAGDDAAGLAISEKMRGQIRGLDQASRNSQDGISLIQTAEGALSETHSMLQRMRELTVQSNNGTNTADDLTSIQKEITALSDEITRVATKTEFNTKTLLNGSLGTKAADGTVAIADLTTAGITVSANGVKPTETITFAVDATTHKITATGTNSGVSQTLDLGTGAVKSGANLNFDKLGLSLAFGADSTQAALNTLADGKTITTTGSSLSFQIGANNNTTLSISIGDMTSSALGAGNGGTLTSISAVNVKTASFDDNLKVIDQAISQVSSQRADLGAWQNRLEHTINNLNASSENLSAAESRVRDVDMAKEMMEQTKNNILSQAAQAMLAQANQQPQGVLQLLR